MTIGALVIFTGVMLFATAWNLAVMFGYWLADREWKK